MNRYQPENERDTFFQGLDYDGFPNSAEIVAVYGLQGLTALLQYEFAMDLINKAEERGIKITSKAGFVAFARSINEGTNSDRSFDQLARTLENEHQLEEGQFAEIHEFAYGCEELTTRQKNLLGRDDKNAKLRRVGKSLAEQTDSYSLRKMWED
jgi:hypothetical protein